MLLESLGAVADVAAAQGSVLRSSVLMSIPHGSHGADTHEASALGVADQVEERPSCHSAGVPRWQQSRDAVGADVERSVGWQSAALSPWP
jgi:hypothetical protein